MGGIGKTALSIKLVEQIQDKFEYVIWCSLQNAPAITNILTDLIQFLSNQEKTDLPEDVDARISLLINYLQKHQCLLVLDNAESVMREGDHAGSRSS